MKEAKEILYQQLELLAERSKKTDFAPELAELSRAMVELYSAIIIRVDNYVVGN